MVTIKQITIADKIIGLEYPCFIVAEIGVNHNRDLSLAKKLIKEAAKCGVNAIKFQTWNTNNIAVERVSMASYQRENIGHDISQYDMLKELELPYEWHNELKKLAEQEGLVFFSTMEDRESVDFLLKDIKIPLIKVGSGDLTNFPLLKYTAKFGIPIILSTGMASLSDIDKAIRIVHDAGNDQIILLQCTTQYPAPYDSINLNAILTLKNAFNTLVGLSDHSEGVECSIAAIALGAKYIEKHFTLDKKMPGPDHRASLEPKEFKQLVRSIRIVESAMGDGCKRQTSSEKECQKIVYRRIVAAKDIKPGEIFNEQNVTFKRSDTGLYASYFDLITGLKSKHSVPCNNPINFCDVEVDHDN